ncbi:MAG: hypothetical protein GF401_15060 [Chitinivibrionales bacterium]|nr:hypothetical protein [Chitinivibrionales bacterium]
MHRSMSRKSFNYLFLGLLSVVIIGTAGSVRAERNVRYIESDTAIHGNAVHLSLRTLAKSFGFKSAWNEQAQKLICNNKDHHLVFSPENPFCVIDSVVYQFVFVPIMDNDELWLQAGLCADVFDRVRKDSVCWDADSGKMAVHSVSRILKKKQKSKPQAVSEPPRKNTMILEPQPPSKSKIQGKPIQTIVIDPGHGGKDPGAIGAGGTLEKDVVLGIGLALREILKEKTSFNIHLTRETDKFIPLRDRTEFANKKKADLFISIHANSIGGSKKKRNAIKGFKIYFLSQAKNEEDKMVAMKENSAIEFEENVDKGDYLQNILIDLAGNEYQNESQDLSIMLAEAFDASLKKVGKLHRGVGQAPFWVLNGAFMPSVLIETAFISNPREEKVLGTGPFQKEAAFAIFTAIMSFKKKYEAEL